MIDYVNKIISIILIFILGVMCPINISYTVDRANNKRVVLSETSVFLDKVTDKAQITQNDIDEFNMQINSHGMILHADIDRLVRVDVENPDGDIDPIYIPSDKLKVTNTALPIYELTKGDVVRVKITETLTSAADRMFYFITHITNPQYELTLAKVVS